MSSDPLYPQAPAVLCPALHRRLQQLFPGGVVVANAGEPFVPGSYLDGTTGRYKTVPMSCGEYYRVSCGFCGDSRKRLWINHMYGQPDAGGRPMYWLATCYNNDCLTSPENWQRLREAIFGIRNRNDRHPPFAVQQAQAYSTPAGSPEPPGELLHLSQLLRHRGDHPALRYLLSRGYTEQLLSQFEVSVCTRASPRYYAAEGRIVFPIREHGQLIGWQARVVGDAPPGTGKYYTMPGFKKSQHLYNYDVARQSPFVVVMEGVTDVHALPACGVALLGKTLSSRQQQLLLAGWPQAPIVFLLDADAQEEMQGMVANLQQQRREPVVPVSLPYGVDPGQSIGTGRLVQYVVSQCERAGVRLYR